MPEEIDRRLSFNGGEISTLSAARVDLDKYRSSTLKCVNMVPMIWGGAYGRSGTNYIDTALGTDITRVESFEYSFNNGATRDAFCFEFGAGYVSFLIDGARVNAPAVLWMLSHAYNVDDYVVVYPDLTTPYRCLVAHTSSADFPTDLAAGKWVIDHDYRLTTPYSASEVFGLQFVQQNDVVFVTHPNHQPRIISRTDQLAFQIGLFEQEWPAVRDENITTTTLTPSAVTGTTTITASAPLFDAAHVGSRWLIIYRREDPSVDIDLKMSSPGDTTDPLFLLGDWSCNVRAVSTGYGDFTIKLIVERSYDKVTWETLRTIGSEKASIQAIITGTEIDPCFLRIRYLSNSGTIPVGTTAILEALDPDQYGIFEITAFTSSTVVTANVLFELGGTTATLKWNEAAWSDFRGWPRAITLHEQRLYFAGNVGEPQTIWGSVINDYTNFRIGTDDNLGLAFTIAADQSFGIVWLQSQQDLLVGTGGSEWVITGKDRDSNITPSTARAKRASAYGSANLPALAAEASTIFVQRSTKQVYEMAYSFQTDNQASNLLTLLAEHISGTGIQQLCIQKLPGTILWFATTDGRLIGLVYERSQQVTGWFQVTCDNPLDQFESVTVGIETVFCVVKRVINGVTHRYIESFQPGHLDVLRLYQSGPSPLSLVYTDCSKTLGDPMGDTKTIWAGLDHLEGRTVQVMADGVLQPDCLVTGGQITIATPARQIIAGLQFTSLLQPTWFETNDPGTISKPGVKRQVRALIEFYRTLGCEVAADGINFDPIKFREPDTIGPPDFFTGEREPNLRGFTSRQVALTLRQRQPLPFCILSLHVSIDLNRA